MSKKEFSGKEYIEPEPPNPDDEYASTGIIYSHNSSADSDRALQRKRIEDEKELTIEAVINRAKQLENASPKGEERSVSPKLPVLGEKRSRGRPPVNKKIA